VKPFRIGDVEIGGPRLFVIAGPCVVESEELCLGVARRLAIACAERDIPFVFKSSYRKANRSSAASFQGLPTTEALAVLGTVRRETGTPVITDVHEVAEVEEVAAVVDALQVPAFLSRQTALIQACAHSGRAVNIKKGQFLAPGDMARAVEKAVRAGGRRVLVTERGTTFGYGDLVVDYRGLVIMRELGWPVVFDCTHSLQRPGGEETGGDRRFAVPLMRAAVACGVDGLFFETHPDPERALSDAATQLPLAQVEDFLDEALRVHRAVTERAHA